MDLQETIEQINQNLQAQDIDEPIQSAEEDGSPVVKTVNQIIIQAECHRICTQSSWQELRSWPT